VYLDNRLTVEMSLVFVDHGYHKLLHVGARTLLNVLHPELDVALLPRRRANPQENLAQRDPHNYQPGAGEIPFLDLGHKLI
jgi:hypothetical protein